MAQEMNIKKKRMMIYFIEAAEHLLRTEGIKSLTIRRVAKDAGYNSATLYNYFENIDHLILFASMSYYRDYTEELYQKIAQIKDAREKFGAIYEIFISHAFQYPEIFYTIFFGQYSHRLNAVLEAYFELFPELIECHEPEIKKMLMEGDVYRRDYAVTDQMIEQGYMHAGKRAITLTILTKTLQSVLDDIRNPDKKTDPRDLKEKFWQIFTYLMEAAH